MVIYFEEIIGNPGELLRAGSLQKGREGDLLVADGQDIQMQVNLANGENVAYRKKKTCWADVIDS